MYQLRNIKLRQLECFVEVARQNSVTGASQTLRLTQPAVTRALRELEDALGHRLFEKNGRGIKLSHYGDVYLKFAGESLAAVRRGTIALDDLVLSEGTLLRIGALPTVSSRIMPSVFATYLESSARSPLAITTGDNLQLLEQLRQGNLDIVVGRLAAPELIQGHRYEPLYSEKVVFAVNSDHPLFQLPYISIDSLQNYPMLMPAKTSIIRSYVDRLFIEHGMTPSRQTIETISDSFGRIFTLDYNAIWIISEGVVSKDIARGIFRVLPFSTDTTLGSVGIYFNPAIPPSPSAQILIDILRKQTKEL